MLAVPHNRDSPSIDIHGVKRDLKKALAQTIPFNTEFYGR